MLASILFLLIGIAGVFLGFMQEANSLTPVFKVIAGMGFAVFGILFIRNICASGNKILKGVVF